MSEDGSVIVILFYRSHLYALYLERIFLFQCLLLQVAHLFLLSFFAETVECYNEIFKTYLPAFSRADQEQAK